MKMNRRRLVHKHPKIVVIGGGTGSFTTLSGLKHYTPNLTALVSMVDDGGSTGQFRDEYGVLPPGDVRQCLVALSNSSQEMRDLFNFRFGEGSLDGHSFGNIFLAAVEKMTNDFGDAVRLAEEVLDTTGRVLPITLDNTQLVLKSGGKKIVGQRAIEHTVTQSDKPPEFTLLPAAKINPEARKAIISADMVVLAPGSFYESLVAALIVDGVASALKQTKAQVVQVVNLVTKPGQTDGWTVCDYTDEFARVLGEGTVDVVLYNTKRPTRNMLAQYTKSGEFPVKFRKAQCAGKPYRFVGKRLLSVHHRLLNPHDKLAVERSLIRHDSDALARALIEIYSSK
jgi:uncharacterized cofD-like protein